MPVCILGMHRSGTSMVAHVLSKCGLDLGRDEDLMDPSPDNETGYWEHHRFVEINDEILAEMGASWDNPSNLEAGWAQGNPYKLFQYRVKGLLTEFSSAENWGWKDPRNSLTLEFWENTIPNLKYIVCLRNPLNVAYSLDRRVYTQMPYDQGLELWLKYAESIRLQLPPDRYIVTHYETFFYDPVAELQRLLHFLDIEAPSGAIQEAVNEIRDAQRHNFVAEQLLNRGKIPHKIVQHYRAFCTETGPVFEQMLSDQEFQKGLLEENLYDFYDKFVENRKTIGELNQALQQVAAERGSLENHAAQLNQALQQVTAEKESRENHAAQLSQALQQLTAEKGSLENHAAQLSQALQQVTAEKESRENHVAQLSQALQQLTAERSALERNIEEQRAQLNQALQQVTAEKESAGKPCGPTKPGPATAHGGKGVAREPCGPTKPGAATGYGGKGVAGKPCGPTEPGPATAHGGKIGP